MYAFLFPSHFYSIIMKKKSCMSWVGLTREANTMCKKSKYIYFFKLSILFVIGYNFSFFKIKFQSFVMSITCTAPCPHQGIAAAYSSCLGENRTRHSPKRGHFISIYF